MINTNITICILLWFFFGLQHSILARPSTKRIISKIFGLSFEKHFYPLIYFISQCIIFLAIYDMIRHLVPTYIFFVIPEKFELFIYCLNRLSNLFLIITIFHFDIGRFIGITQLIEFFFQKQKNEKNLINDTKLNSSYLYKYIRHPMYLGIILVFITSTTIYTDLFLLNIICIVLYIEIGSYFEEKSLIKKFGNQYIEYQKKTKRYIPILR